MNISLFPLARDNFVSRNGFRSPVQRQPAHLHTQAESGAYLRDSSRFLRQRPYIYLDQHTPSGQSRAYRVTLLHIDGVNCPKVVGTGPVNLTVVPVTGAALAGLTIIEQLMCTSLFPHSLLLVCNSGHVENIGGKWGHLERWMVTSLLVVTFAESGLSPQRNVNLFCQKRGIPLMYHVTFFSWLASISRNIFLGDNDYNRT